MGYPALSCVSHVYQTLFQCLLYLFLGCCGSQFPFLSPGFLHRMDDATDVHVPYESCREQDDGYCDDECYDESYCHFSYLLFFFSFPPPLTSSSSLTVYHRGTSLTSVILPVSRPRKHLNFFNTLLTLFTCYLLLHQVYILIVNPLDPPILGGIGKLDDTSRPSAGRILHLFFSNLHLLRLQKGKERLICQS